MQYPKWKYIGNLGDVTPLEHGGKFVYIDETGEYSPEIEILDNEIEENGCYVIHRFALDRMQTVTIEGEVYLLFAEFKEIKEESEKTIRNLAEWFSDKIVQVCDYAGINVEEFYTDICSDDVLKRARCYISIGEYMGYDNFGFYPKRLTLSQVKKRYTNGELQ